MSGELLLVDEIVDEIFEFEINPSSYDFSLSIYVDEKKTLDKQLKNIKSFNECIKYMQSIDVQEYNYYDDHSKEINYVRDNLEYILDSVEYIKFDFKKHNIMDYINSNPKIISKKIVLNEILEITDFNRLMELIYEYKDIKDKVYVTLVDNSNYVSLNDCYKTMNAIKIQADEIKSLNLSPMETIMYVYDIVRNRVYEHEEEGDSLFKSRDLTEVMFGDKIVCAGYVSIFHALLSYLGIDSGVVRLIDKNDESGRTGHTRNIVYVQDPKYNIDGVYYFDPTWDSKRKGEGNEYLYRYNFFAQTRNQVDSDERFHYQDITFSDYSTDIYDKVERIIKSGNYYELADYFKSMNHMSFIVKEGLLIKAMDIIPSSPTYGCFDSNELLEKFKNISSKFNKELSAETMIELLNNVRKIQNIQNPNWYFYSIDDLYRTYKISKWKFDNSNVSDSTKILLAIFQQDVDFDKELFIKFIKDNDILRDVKQAALIKVLKQELNNKKD